MSPERLTAVLPLVAGLHLVHTGHGDEVRFQSLCRSVWQRLPALDRRRLERFWSGRGKVTLTPDAGPPPLPPIEVYIATCYGRRLWFNSNAIDRLPNELVLLVVAHELAHTLQHAVKWEANIGEDEERDADARTEAWGFGRRGGITRWARENGGWDRILKRPAPPREG